MPEELCQVSPKSHYGVLASHSDPSPCVNLLSSGYEQKKLNCGQSVKVLMSTLLPRCHLSKYHTQQTVQKTSAQFNRVLLLLSELSIIQSPVLLLDLGQVWVWPEETWKIYRQLPASEFLTFDLQEIHSCPSDAMAHPLWSSRVTWQRRKIAQGYHAIHSLASTVAFWAYVP